ncbi:MAG TPA: hypothetical protein VFF73_32975 [Planctomycetota bacterium]|nr:hypothetical protein [Planctomycetota bacterium]
MKGPLLGVLVFAAMVSASAIGFRLQRSKKYYRILLAELPLGLITFFLVWRATPATLGFLPEAWLEPSPLVDAGAGALICVLLFHCFWDTVYLLHAGLSAQVLVAIDEDPTLDEARFLRSLGAEKDVDLILGWRIPNLIRGGHVEPVGTEFRLLPRGRLVGGFTRLLKRILTGEDGGG